MYSSETTKRNPLTGKARSFLQLPANGGEQRWNGTHCEGVFVNHGLVHESKSMGGMLRALV